MYKFYDYGIGVAYLSEVCLPNPGSRCTLVPKTKASYQIYHSGPKDNSELHGAAIKTNSRAHGILIS